MDRKNQRLFVAGRNPKMPVMLDAGSGKVVGPSFPIGNRVDTTIYDPESGLVFASTREGTIHVFHEDTADKLSVVEVVKTEFGAKTMGFDSKTHNLFVDTSDFDPPARPPESSRSRNRGPSQERFGCWFTEGRKPDYAGL
jgi:hypothetical protein